MSTKIILNLFIYCILFDCCIFEMRIITTYGTNPWKTYDYVLAVGHFSSFNLKKKISSCYDENKQKITKLSYFNSVRMPNWMGITLTGKRSTRKKLPIFFLSLVAKFVFSSETFCVSEFCSWATFSVVR